MHKRKREQLKAKGWKDGTVAEFLGLTPEESTLTENRLTLLALARTSAEANDRGASEEEEPITECKAKMSIGGI